MVIPGRVVREPSGVHQSGVGWASDMEASLSLGIFSAASSIAFATHTLAVAINREIDAGIIVSVRTLSFENAIQATTDVFALGHRLQMAGSSTQSHSTKVVENKALRDWTNQQAIREHMSRLTSRAELSVSSALHLGSCPEPTRTHFGPVTMSIESLVPEGGRDRAVLVDLGPEPFFDRWAKVGSRAMDTPARVVGLTPTTTLGPSVAL